MDWMRALFLMSIFIVLSMEAFAGTRPVAVPGEFRAVVTWVVDGDSIRFRRDHSGAEDECRMLHYNAPEITGAERPEGRKALRELIRLIKGKKVLIWGLDRDRYGRLLCEVRLMDGTYVNDLMRKFLKDYRKRDIYLWKETNQNQRRKAAEQ